MTSGAPDPSGLSGRTVSHFRVLEPLGAGGMGVVYRAEDLTLGRTVALKFMLPDYTIDDTAEARFLREARSVAALDHPNICTVHEAGTSADGLLYLAMSYYSGETLKERLTSNSSFPVDRALDIAGQIARGLSCAHAAGIVHRDLKPANVMLTSDGTVKILDFGLAKSRDQTLTASGTVMGTVAYMAPEQLLGEQAVPSRATRPAHGTAHTRSPDGPRHTCPRRPAADSGSSSDTRCIGPASRDRSARCSRDTPD